MRLGEIRSAVEGVILGKTTTQVSLMNNTCLDLVFPAVGGRKVCARCDGGDIASDAGLLPISLADAKLGLTEAMADCASRFIGTIQEHAALELI